MATAVPPATKTKRTLISQGEYSCAWQCSQWNVTVLVRLLHFLQSMFPIGRLTCVTASCRHFNRLRRSCLKQNSIQLLLSWQFENKFYDEKKADFAWFSGFAHKSPAAQKAGRLHKNAKMTVAFTFFWHYLTLMLSREMTWNELMQDAGSHRIFKSLPDSHEFDAAHVALRMQEPRLRHVQKMNAAAKNRRSKLRTPEPRCRPSKIRPEGRNEWYRR